MKKCVAILGMVAVLSIVELTQAATINFFWWTDVAGGNVDASGNTWNVYCANGNPNPQLGSGAWDKWTPMSYSDGLWGNSNRPDYNSSKTFQADGYYNAPGVTIQAGQSGTYSWQGSASATEYNDATLTFGKIVNGTWSSLAEIVIPVYSSTDLSTISALQNISLGTGDQLTLYIRKDGGGWVDCSMAAATINFAPPTLTVTPENRPVDSMAGTTTFNVEISAGVPWTAEVISGGDWLTITGGASGNTSGTITASYTNNTTSVQRTAIIRATISAAGSTPTDITVTQVKSGVRILPWHWWTDANGSEVDITGNTWYVFSDQGSQTPDNFMNSWMQLEYFADHNAWMASENDQSGMMYSNGYLDNGGSWYAIGFAILVPQNAKYSFSGTITDYVWNSPTVGVSVANADGTLDRVLATFTAGPTTEWSSIASLQNIRVTAGQFILIGTGSAGGGGWVQANIGQISMTVDATATPALSVTPETSSVDSIAGSTTFTVANTDMGTMPWTAEVIGGGDWLTITNGASGTDSGTITAGFTANTTTTQRTATIRVTAIGAADSPKDITITQVKSGVRLITWHWWTNAAGGDVDAAGNTWAVYLDRNLTSPDNFQAAGNDGWSQLKFNPDYGNTGAWFRYEADDQGNENAVLVHPDMRYENSVINNEGNWWAIGFSILAADDGLYSFGGKVPNFLYGNSLTVTISVANADGTLNRTISAFTATPDYDWADNAALQNINVKAGQYILIGTGSSAGGGWVQASMSDINMFVEKVTTRIPGDATGDGKVDVSDLGILAANYGGTGKTWAQGDFTGDGKVDVSDLGILAAHYGTGTGAVLDFNKDAAALGLVVGNDQATAKDDTPVTSALGCGSAGLPLIAGIFLVGLMLVKLDD